MGLRAKVEGFYPNSEIFIKVVSCQIFNRRVYEEVIMARTAFGGFPNPFGGSLLIIWGLYGGSPHFRKLPWFRVLGV